MEEYYAQRVDGGSPSDNEQNRSEAETTIRFSAGVEYQIAVFTIKDSSVVELDLEFTPDPDGPVSVIGSDNIALARPLTGDHAVGYAYNQRYDEEIPLVDRNAAVNRTAWWKWRPESCSIPS